MRVIDLENTHIGFLLLIDVQVSKACGLTISWKAYKSCSVNRHLTLRYHDANCISEAGKANTGESARTIFLYRMVQMPPTIACYPPVYPWTKVEGAITAPPRFLI